MLEMASRAQSLLNGYLAAKQQSLVFSSWFWNAFAISG